MPSQLPQVSEKNSPLFDELGIEFDEADTPVFSNMQRAEHCYIHHSMMPVAIAAYSLISPAFARGRFPKTRLADVVAKRPSMDEREAKALATVCDGAAWPPFWGNAPQFARHLFHVIEHYRMDAFFQRVAGEYHRAIRPRGVDWRTDEIDPAAMRAWRKAYKALRPVDQMMVATVLWLYRGGEDKTWLRGVPKDWHAADAIDALVDAEANYLEDWATLVACYPGW